MFIAFFGCMCSVANASAENLIPNVSPNVVLTCLENGKEALACTFGCANMLGVVGKTSTSGFGVTKASRVEMYTGQKAGRDDQHVWVAYRHGEVAGFSSVGFAFVSSTFTCQWPGEIRSGDNKVSWQWRIDKFDQ